MTAPTLTEFLLARIAEDEEEWTRDGAHEDWCMDPSGRLPAHDGACFYCGHLPDSTMDVHVLPSARVLAECEAKRRIVEAASEATGLDMQVDGEFGCGPRDMVADPYLGDVLLRALAVPYADHPDFDPAWRP